MNAVPINWAGTQRIGETNATIRDALDMNCSGDDWCYIACHSAGCAQIAYALSMYGSTGGNDTWNISWVAAAGAAVGGSEIANLKLWSTTVPLDEDLKTAAMRSLYVHENTGGVTFFMFAGAGYSDSKPLYNANGAQLPGNDDLAVAYHSSCGVSNDAYMLETTWCNSGELCTGNHIDLGSQAYLWPLHSIEFLDSSQSYSHFVQDSNAGICSQLFSFMTDNAL